MSVKKGINLPFVLKEFYAPTKMKLFLFLIREMGLTQSDAQRFIARGRVFKDDIAITSHSADIEGHFKCIQFEPISRGLEPIFQTDTFALFDKPSGVLVHPQNRATPYSMIDEIRYRFGASSNIVHRIDQETSGLLLASTDKASERKLKTLFENREVQKEYLALVHGRVKHDIEIDEPLLREEDHSAIVRMVVKVDSCGKESKTHIEPIAYYPDRDMTLICAKPHTGRQHQIRVHLFHVKHPIVGDPIYGQKESDILRFLDRELDDQERIRLSGASRLMLHANVLMFNINSTYYKLKSRSKFMERVVKIASN